MKNPQGLMRAFCSYFSRGKFQKVMPAIAGILLLGGLSSAAKAQHIPDVVTLNVPAFSFMGGGGQNSIPGNFYGGKITFTIGGTQTATTITVNSVNLSSDVAHFQTTAGAIANPIYDLGGDFNSVDITVIDPATNDKARLIIIPQSTTATPTPYGISELEETIAGLGGSPFQAPVGGAFRYTDVFGKNLGHHCPCEDVGATGPVSVDGQASAGDPIDIGSGNVYYQQTDYTTAGQNPLVFTRSYNSRSVATNTSAVTLGPNWRSNYDRSIQIPSSSIAILERSDGQQLKFSLSGSTWAADTDVDITLTHSGSTWTVKDGSDTTETYTTNSGGTAAYLATIVARNGYTQTMAYNGSGQLSTVTDSYSRVLTLAYTSGKLSSLTTPESNVFTYQYNANGALQYVLSPYDATRSPVRAYTYAYFYGNTSSLYALTGINDRWQQRFETWDYDALGRGLDNYQGDPAYTTTSGTTSITYNDTTGARTVTTPLNVGETYTFTTLQNIPKVTGISRTATSTTPAMSRSLTYDSNGYLASETDWNGNTTTYVRNSHGLPTSITEASGTSIARTTTIAYDPTWVRKPATITKPGLTTTFTYDSGGNVLTKTLADTSGQSQPSRTWTNTYSTVGNLLTTQNPRGNTTTFTYTSGALTQVKNALNQITNITSHTTGGYPQTIVDPNGVTHTIAYDQEMRPLSRAVVTSGGTFTTNYLYYVENIILNLVKPDGTIYQSGIDSTHRVYGMFGLDSSGNQFAYKVTPLDAASDATELDFYGTTNTAPPERKTNMTYDALGRQLTVETSSNSQTTTFTYDKNGNQLTATDANGNQTVYSYDALNRRITWLSPSSAHTTTYTYNAWDKVTTVVDGQPDTWTYVYDGFGELLSKQGPGQPPSYSQVPTLYTYDKQGNVTQKKDARLVVANYTFDALDRLLTTVYPASTTENVTNTYDQTGHGFGIGHLTSATDAAGTLSRSYDERGNITIDSRVVTGVTLATNYTWDSVGHLASITYPSGAKQSFTYDPTDEIAGLAFLKGTVSKTGTMTHEPFGQMTSLTNFNAGVTESFAYNTDGWMTSATAVLSSTSLMNRSYQYDNAGNLSEADDNNNIRNENQFWYDASNRMNNFHFGGADGGHVYQFDNIGNSYSDETFAPNIQQGPNNSFYDQPASGLTQIDYKSDGYNVTTSYMITSDADHRFTGISPAYPGIPAGYVYNNAGRLTQVKNAAGTVLASYLYDEFGRRIVKTVGSTNTLYVYSPGNWQMLEETNGSGVAQQDYLYADGRLIDLWVPAATALYQVHTDRMFAAQSVTDSTGTVKWKADWNPYGDIRNLTVNGVTLNIRYPGQYYDAESGLIQNGMRDLVPQWNRYLEEDPLGQAADENVRAYVSNRPVSGSDPSGMLDQNLLPTHFPWQQGYGPYTPGQISVTERQRSANYQYDDPNGYSVSAHGNPGNIFDEDGNPISPDELAASIMNDENYYPGEQVTLFACSTGKGNDSFAQHLADALGAPVIAPDDLQWDHFTHNWLTGGESLHEPTIGPTRNQNTGNWRIFSPRD